MKKILVLLCCTALLPLTACGQGAPQQTTPSQTTVSDTQRDINDNANILEPAVLAPDIDQQLEGRIGEPVQTGTTLQGF